MLLARAEVSPASSFVFVRSRFANAIRRPVGGLEAICGVMGRPEAKAAQRASWGFCTGHWLPVSLVAKPKTAHSTPAVKAILSGTNVPTIHVSSTSLVSIWARRLSYPARYSEAFTDFSGEVPPSISASRNAPNCNAIGFYPSSVP